MSIARFCVAAARLAPALALLLATAAATTAPAQVRCWQDPVVAHTNGMRLASTTSQRSHNVYWRCDEDHTGYCDGRMHGCLKNDLRSLGTRHHGYYCFKAGPRPGPVGAVAPRGTDGLETEDGGRIGSLRFIPTNAPGAPRTARLTSATLPIAAPEAAAPAPAAAETPSGPSWYSELQRLGEKMQVTGSATLP